MILNSLIKSIKYCYSFKVNINKLDNHKQGKTYYYLNVLLYIMDEIYVCIIKLLFFTLIVNPHNTLSNL